MNFFEKVFGSKEQRAQRRDQEALASALAHLKQILDTTEDYQEEQKLEKELAKLGSPSVPTLILWLDRVNPLRTQRAAANALGMIGDLRAVETLLVSLGRSNDRSDACESAARALGKLRDQRAVGSLVEALTDRNLPLQAHAKKALKLLGWKPTNAEQIVAFTDAGFFWVRCKGCGRKYVFLRNALVVTTSGLLGGFSLATVLNSPRESTNENDPDLVDSINDAWESVDYKTKDKQHKELEMLNWHSQFRKEQRYWKCASCETVQKYDEWPRGFINWAADADPDL